MVDSGQNYLLVAAIDFGTTFSGFAYSSKNDYNNENSRTKNIFSNEWNSGEKSLITSKTPTILLLNKDKSFRAFGFEAENLYQSICAEFTQNESDSDTDEDDEQEEKEKENPHELYYFERFKMELHNTKTFSSNSPMKELNGKTLPAIEIFSKAIQFLAAKVFERVSKAYADIKGDDIKYVLTVPAIWDDTAKTFMKAAAKQAGIAIQNLQIALEPESASILCFEKYMDERERGLHWEVGKPYMVVDLGGGTADITVYSRNDNNTLKEIVPPSGGPWGGKCVDDDFVKLWQNLLGEDVIEEFKAKHHDDFIALFKRDFELKKRGKYLGDRKVNFSVPYTLQKIVKNKAGSIENAIKSNSLGDSDISFKNSRLLIPNNILKNLFQPLANAIVKHIQHMFTDKKLKNLKTILMVGGFSNCSIVQEAMKNAFKSVKIIIPAEAELAVLQGAVLFGHRQTIISTRISRFTYGMQNWPLFDKQRHSASKRIIINGEVRCKEAFLRFVSKGQEIPTGHEVKRVFQILEAEQNKFECIIYKSLNPTPEYIDEEGVTLVGTLEIPIELSPGSTVDVEETLKFGDTTISFQARNRKTGQQFQTHFKIPKDND